MERLQFKLEFSMRDSLDIILLRFFLMLFCLFVFLCYSILCIVHAFVPSSLAMLKKLLFILLPICFIKLLCSNGIVSKDYCRSLATEHPPPIFDPISKFT